MMGKETEKNRGDLRQINQLDKRLWTVSRSLKALGRRMIHHEGRGGADADQTL